MRKILFVVMAFVLFTSHDMYLKLDTYFLNPHSSAKIKLFNGTFEKSDNVIARNRMVDASLVGEGNRIEIDTSQWSEKDDMTILSFETGNSGTWVVGVSTRPRNIEMSAADFNNYLEHDGVLDMLDWRKQNNALEKDAIEKYSKHVKTIFQVGNERTDDWQKILGYPIEFIPLSNPYDIHAGHDIKFELLWQGQPLANQLVYVDSYASDHSNHDHSHADDGHSHDHSNEGEHSHSHADDGHSHDHSHEDEHSHSHAEDNDHHHHSGTQLRTDANGTLTVPLTTEGEWYLRTIYLVHSDEPGLTHESNWATLTFAVGPGHSHGAHDHSHAEEHHHHEEGDVLGIPGYVFWIGSLLVVAGLFFWFNRKT